MQFPQAFFVACHFEPSLAVYNSFDGFGGLVVSMLASGTQVCVFKPGRSRWIFTDVKILSMRHVKLLSNLRELRIAS